MDLTRTGDPEMADGPLGARQHARLAAAIATAVGGWLGANAWFPGHGQRVAGAAVRRFLRVYGSRPAADNAGGSRFNACAWLFVLTRLIAPRLIIESGTHRGQSAWLFRQAAPDARILTFDITHQALSHRQPGIDYRLGDWSDADLPPVDADTSLGFFDDHVDQARRVREAWARGLRWLVFDDNLPAHLLFVTGRPPAPTISMLFDPSLRDGERLAWTRRGRPRSIDVDQEAWAEARRLIAHWSVLPDLAPATGCRPQTGLTVVRLADRPR
ncbi:MAG: hypothetical protein H6842_09305 [Rhodospirillaceae bacterium]|nr:hypothetical protein [Rhodospirillaceae bacterium]